MFWRLVLILSLAWNKGLAQSIEQTYSLAKQKEGLGLHWEAIEYYERGLFFDTLNNNLEARKSLAQLYLKVGHEDWAINELKRYRNFFEFGDSTWQKTTFELIGIQLFSHQELEALAELFVLEGVQLSKEEMERWTLYRAVTEFQLSDYQKSKYYFSQLVDNEEQPVLESIFKKNNRLEKRYNSYRLQVLSAIIPGSGQLVIGEKREALNSFLLVGSFTGLLIYTAHIYTLADAILSVYPWASRYQMGGIRKLPKMAQEKINEKRALYYKEILTMVKD